MSYQSPTTPMPHQTEALERIASRPSLPAPTNVFALLLDMGTGKSKIICDEWGASDFRNLIVIAPAGSYANWWMDRPEKPSELRAHLDPRLWEQGLTVAPWISGGGKHQRDAISRLLRARGRRVLVVNVEALSTVERAVDACLALASEGPTMCVVDESTRIRNPSASRTKAVIKIGSHCQARRIATGLVAPRSPLDVFSQYQFLDQRILGFNNYYAFRARYAVVEKKLMRGRHVPIVVGHRNVDELWQKMAPYSFRKRLEDCIRMPPKIYSMRTVELTSEQRRVYCEMRDDAISRIGEYFASSTLAITTMLRLQQILCGFVTTESGEIVKLPSNRDAEVVRILDEHRGKAIIWTAFDQSVRSIRDLLAREFGERSVATFWGGNRATRLEEESRFLSDTECKYMISTPQSGGLGNTWVVATLAIYHSNTYSLEDREQSEKRPYRRGQDKTVNIVDLVARGTLDEKVIKALRSKQEIAATIQGERVRDWLI